MNCWNLEKQDLSELISENLESTTSCQQNFLISWNLINGLLSTDFNLESSARSHAFAKWNKFFSSLIFFSNYRNKFFYNRNLDRAKNSLFHWFENMVNSLRSHQTNTPFRVYLLFFYILITQISSELWYILFHLILIQSTPIPFSYGFYGLPSLRLYQLVVLFKTFFSEVLTVNCSQHEVLSTVNESCPNSV